MGTTISSLTTPTNDAVLPAMPRRGCAASCNSGPVAVMAALGRRSWVSSTTACVLALVTFERLAAQEASTDSGALAATTTQTIALDNFAQAIEDLDAMAGDVNPPTLDELLSRLEPIPSVAELVSGIDQPPVEPLRLGAAPQSEYDALATELFRLREANAFDEAVSVVERLYRICLDELGPDHVETQDMLHTLATTRTCAASSSEAQSDLARACRLDAEADVGHRSGRDRDAVCAKVEALRLRRKHLGLDHILVAKSHADLGYFLGRLGEYDRAILQHRVSAGIRLEALGAHHHRVADNLNSLSTLLWEVADYGRAERCARAALAVRRSTWGDADAHSVFSMSNLANVLTDVGDYVPAQLLFDRAIQLERGARGGTTTLAVLYESLGFVLERTGDVGRSELYYREALAIFRSLHGDRHPDTANALNNLAHVLRARGEYPEAVVALSDALRNARSTLGIDHPLVGKITHNLAALHLELREYKKAEELLKVALEMSQREFGALHPHTLAVLNTRAVLLKAMGRTSEAEHLQEQLLRRRRERFGPNHPESTETLLNLASILAERTDAASADRADELFQRAVGIRRRYNRPDLHYALARYARFLYTVRKRPADAVACFELAIGQIETLRTTVRGGGVERAMYSTALNRWEAFEGIVRAKTMQISRGGDEDRAAALAKEAYSWFERGRGRAVLDLIASGRNGVQVRSVKRMLADRGPNSEMGVLLTRATKAHFAQRSAAASVKRALMDPESGELQRADRIPELAARHDRARLRLVSATSDLQRLTGVLGEADTMAPMDCDEVCANLKPHELLLAFDVAARSSLLIVVTSESGVTVRELVWPDQSRVTEESLASEVSSVLLSLGGDGSMRPAGMSDREARTAADLLNTLIPLPIRARIASATRVFIIPGGPLHQLPFGALLSIPSGKQRWIDEAPPIVYGPSGTVIMTKRKWARERKPGRMQSGSTALLAVGDPVFTRPGRTVAEASATPNEGTPSPEPEHGVLLAEVTADSNAAASGLRAGDVLLSYDQTKLQTPADLGPAIQAAAARRANQQPSVGQTRDGGDTSNQDAGTAPSAPRVPITIWRDGRNRELTLAPGRMGVQPSQASMPIALHDWRELQLTEDERFVKYAAATTRDGFGELNPLPGTRVEVDAISKIVQEAGGGSNAVTVLTGENATLSKLFEAAHKPRFLHIATHGLAEEGRRVYESALALTVPKEPTPDDYGFLRLQDLLYKWGGKLDGTELVVLSACRTARGRLAAGDGFVGLTWGFLFAGADSVIASLWKVDDAATTLLMTRLYENLLGDFQQERGGFPAGTEMPKAEALHEAKRWLRSRSPQQNRDRLAALGFDVESWQRARGGRLPSGDPEPLPEPFDFSHPRYWAAFVLIGSPD